MQQQRTRNAFVGSPVERIEDFRFLRGRGQFVDDLARDDLLHAVILRSSVAHGRIRGIATAAARARPGVHAIITAADIGAVIPRIPLRQESSPAFEPFEQPVIAHGKVRYVGEPIAVVLAESAGAAEDALDAITLDIESLPAVVDSTAAGKNDILLFEAASSNLALTLSGVRGDADAAFNGAAYVRRERFTVQRHGAVPMEPRGLLAEWDAAGGRLTVHGAAKVAFLNRRVLAKHFGLPESAIRMVENDVGGGFGARGEFYPEDFLIPFAARLTGRPVKWIEDRREHLLATNHARDAECELEIACDRDGTILALRGRACTDQGAYIRTNGPTAARNIAQVLTGPYRIPHVRIDVSLMMTNKTPSGTYRGPGRFEADFFRERLFDIAAAELGLDRVAFRRRNLIAEAEMPYRLATVAPLNIGTETDSGDYGMTLARCLDEIDWSAKAAIQGKLIDGRYRGTAIGCYLEGGASGPKESARLVLESDGKVSVYVGSSSIGQGLETVCAQIAADALEMPMHDIKAVFHGSTDHVIEGYGSYSSRSVVMGGNALLMAAGELRDAIRAAAAVRWGCAAKDVAIDAGKALATRRTIAAARRLRRDVGGIHLCQQQAHLQLRRPCRPCRGGSQDRPGRAARLRRGRGCRTHHQPADPARTVRRRHRAGARRRLPGTFRLRPGRPTADRLVCGLPAADRERFSQHSRGGARRAAVTDQSARRQGRGRRRHHSGRRRHRQRGGGGTRLARRRAARPAAVAAAGVGAYPCGASTCRSTLGITRRIRGRSRRIGRQDNIAGVFSRPATRPA